MKYLPYQCASISCNEKKDFNSVPKLGPTPPQLPHPSQKYHQTTPTNALPLKRWTLEKWANYKPILQDLMKFLKVKIVVRLFPKINVHNLLWEKICRFFQFPIKRLTLKHIKPFDQENSTVSQFLGWNRFVVFAH